MSNNDTLYTIYINSGKDYNDLGRFSDCKELKGFNYILASVPHVFPIPIALGICVPSVCNVPDFINYQPYIVAAINSIIPEFFKDIKGFDVSTKLKTSDLKFDDSKRENEEALVFD